MTTLSRLLFSSVTVITLSSIASAITTLHDVSDSSYIAFANQSPTSSIGEVNGQLSGGGGTYLGFGNGSHWVLTAGHMTFENPIANVRFGDQTISALGQITHFGYSGFANDLGLVQIASAPSGIAPIRFTTRSSLIGQRVIFGGYGLHGSGGGPGAVFYDGANRAAENIVDFSQGSGGSAYWTTTFTNPTLELALPLEGSTAVGDSGGGMFWHDGDDWRLAGVTSFGTDQFSRYGDEAAFVALHNHISWLEQNTGITAVPEPTTMVLLSGLAALALRRRRMSV
jgi:hypothetical protein